MNTTDIEQALVDQYNRNREFWEQITDVSEISKRQNMIEVDVIILSSAKNNELKNTTINSVNSLLKSESDIKFNIYLLEGDLNAVYNFSKRVNVVYVDKKFGYHKFMNLGRKMGKAEYVVLCNNDLIYETGWATSIISEMQKDSNLLSASPFEPKSNSNTTQSYGYTTGKQLNGWCIFQKRKIYEIIGDLDESFRFWCCDDDYGMSIKNKKLKHKLVKESIVNHLDKGSQTLKLLEKEKHFKLTNGGIKRFVEKYGCMPEHLKHL